MNPPDEAPRKKVVVLDGEMLRRGEIAHERAQEIIAEKYPDHETVVHDAALFFEGKTTQDKFLSSMINLKKAEPHLSGDRMPSELSMSPLVAIDFDEVEKRFAALYDSAEVEKRFFDLHPHQIEAMERVKAHGHVMVVGIPSKHESPLYKAHRLGVSATPIPMVWDSLPRDFHIQADNDLAYTIKTLPRMSAEEFEKFNREHIDESVMGLERRYMVSGGRRAGRQWARDNIPVYQWDYGVCEERRYAKLRDEGKTHVQVVRELLKPIKKRRKARAAELDRVGAAYEEKKKVPNE